MSTQAYGFNQRPIKNYNPGYFLCADYGKQLLELNSLVAFKIKRNMTLLSACSFPSVIINFTSMHTLFQSMLSQSYQ